MDRLGYIMNVLDAKKLAENNHFFGLMSIFKCSQGSVVVEKDGQIFDFERGAHIMIYETHSVKFSKWSSDIELIQCEITPTLSAELDPYLSNKIWGVVHHCNPSLFKISELKMLDDIFAHLLIIFKVDSMQMIRQLALHSLINYILILYNLLLLHVDNSDNLEELQSSHISSTIDRFFWLCSQHHIRERNMSFYVDKLHISQRHLYNLTQGALGVTPKQVVDSYVVGTIKKLLLTTSLTIQQITETLDFADQSTLRQYFVRLVGLSPSEYRRRNRQ